jgi:hypothetical protein
MFADVTLDELELPRCALTDLVSVSHQGTAAAIRTLNVELPHVHSLIHPRWNVLPVSRFVNRILEVVVYQFEKLIHYPGSSSPE